MHLLLIPAIILLVVAGLLIVPFNLSLNVRNEGFCIFGFYRLKFLGFTVRKAEILKPEKVRYKREADLRVVIGNKAVDEAPEPDSIRFQKDPRMLIDTFPAFYRFVKNMIRSIHIEQLSCSISFGLNDPSDTAVISGYLWALIAMLPTHRTYIHIYPFFEGDKLDGCINIEVSARLLWVLIASIKALMEKSIRSLLTEILRKKMLKRWSLIKGPVTGIREKCNGNGIKF
jgi:hypothetical protein